MTENRIFYLILFSIFLFSLGIITVILTLLALFTLIDIIYLFGIPLFLTCGIMFIVGGIYVVKEIINIKKEQ